MNAAWVSLIVFCASYVLFVVFPRRVSLTACAGAVVLVATGVLGWREALFEKVDWNVMGLFVGTLVLAEMFMLSRVPAVLAEWLACRTGTARGAMLVLCAFASFISVFMGNVAVVLLMAPVALSLSEKLKTSPVPLLLGIAVCSNLQGTATMTGDPPSMILAGYMRIGYLDFFFYHGRPGIFFAVQVGAIASLLMLARLFRDHKGAAKVAPGEKPRSWVPTWLLVAQILGLSVSTLVDPGFKWFAGGLTLVLACVAALWYSGLAKWGEARSLLKALDWDTTFFLTGVFVLVGGLSDSGWLDKIAAGMSAVAGSSVAAAFVIIVGFSVVLSGFVDNIPYLLAMIPVAEKVAVQMGAPVPLLMFGLLIGACLGGNLTPIGASANIVAMGILKKKGYNVSFADFMRLGVPFTLAAVIPACAFVWVVWRN